MPRQKHIQIMICALYLAIFSGCGKASAEGFQDDLCQANRAFRAKDYAHAEILMRQTICQAYASGHVRDLTLANLLHMLGQILSAEKNYPQSLLVFGQEVQIRENQKGEAGAMAFALVSLADALNQVGNKSEAQDIYRKAIQLMRGLPHTYQLAQLEAHARDQLQIARNKSLLY